MDPVDLLVIIADGLPYPQNVEFVHWHTRSNYLDIAHPSMQWWVRKYCHDCSRYIDDYWK